MVEITKEIGCRIFKRRKSLGLSLIEVANQVGVSNAQIQRIEKAKSKTSMPVLEAIAKSLKVPVDWILTGKELDDSPPVEIEQKPKILHTIIKRLKDFPEDKQRLVLRLIDNLRPNLAALFSAFLAGFRGQSLNPELDIIRAIAVR